MKWEYIAAADIYRCGTYQIVVSHTPDFNERMDLNYPRISLTIPWGAHQYGLVVLEAAIKAHEDVP
jgi:hypothetical protein